MLLRPCPQAAHHITALCSRPVILLSLTMYSHKRVCSKKPCRKWPQAYLGGDFHRGLTSNFSNLQKVCTVRIWEASLDFSHSGLASSSRLGQQHQCERGGIPWRWLPQGLSEDRRWAPRQRSHNLAQDLHRVWYLRCQYASRRSAIHKKEAGTVLQDMSSRRCCRPQDNTCARATPADLCLAVCGQHTVWRGILAAV